jgi:hypothetical protein
MAELHISSGHGGIEAQSIGVYTVQEVMNAYTVVVGMLGTTL